MVFTFHGFLLYYWIEPQQPRLTHSNAVMTAGRAFSETDKIVLTWPVRTTAARRVPNVLVRAGHALFVYLSETTCRKVENKTIMKIRLIIAALLLLGAVCGADEIRHQLYRNGFCTGNPVWSANRRGQIYNNGYCTGNPKWSFRREGNVSRIYLNGYCTGNPKYSVKFDGRRVQFYMNGYCTGNPKKSFELRDGNIQFYHNGYCTGNPSMFISQRGEMIQIYTNGYGTGNPVISIRGGASTTDVIELFLLYCVLGIR